MQVFQAKNHTRNINMVVKKFKDSDQAFKWQQFQGEIVLSA